VDLASLVLSPVRVPLRLAQALDDITAVADRARRDPDPAEEVRDRIDALLAEIRTLNGLAAQILPVGRQIVDGGAELTDEARGLRAVSAEIRDGGAELTQEARALRHVTQDTAEELETVADTVEPLQGAAESVGRVTKRFNRS
jgi:DNA repair ATPase RecN